MLINVGVTVGVVFLSSTVVRSTKKDYVGRTVTASRGTFNSWLEIKGPYRGGKYTTPDIVGNSARPTELGSRRSPIADEFQLATAAGRTAPARLLEDTECSQPAGVDESHSAADWTRGELATSGWLLWPDGFS